MAKEQISADRLRSLLRYDPDTGVFTWRVVHGGRKRIPAGIVAGTRFTPACGKSDYLAITLDGRTYSLHRLAWLYMTGEWPDSFIDHADMDGMNNRWSNLRLATKGQNMQNRRPQKNSKSGRKGVGWLAANRKWRAYICVNRKFRHLGLFDSPEEASAAYLEAAKTLYGEFARA